MHIAELKTALITNHKDFTVRLTALTDADFMHKPKDKWTASQQLEHIIKSVKPVNLAFGLPSFVLKMKFGLANRPSKTYQVVVAKYLKVLSENQNYELPKQFAPENISLKRREKQLNKLETLVKKLASRLDKWNEETLDSHILPHPVMGKLTLREMIYFTIYHVQHHDKQILENLNIND